MVDGPLSSTEFVVMEFNHSNGRLSVHGTYTYSAHNLDDALSDAREAATVASVQKLPVTFVVARVQEEAVFPASQAPG
ncbi:hypothetical protein OHA25_60275 (plasmid) [Nonomuraea sp. NBC_00507]|uniref:hypothetical protein n=1 Tax=Nonomuraea sp. NBC_00507 TaxID=2976002 RepID=UPI002E17C2B7